MKIDWSDVSRSVIANVITGVLVGAVGAYILFSITFDKHERRISKLEERPSLGFTGQASGGREANAVIVVPDGQSTALLISANGFAASASGAFRASIQVAIEVDGNRVAKELIWIPQYLYDPQKFGLGQKDPGETEEQVILQRNFPPVASPIHRLERMGPIELCASTSYITRLGGGTHQISAKCEGDDNTSPRVTLSYMEMRNASETAR